MTWPPAPLVVCINHRRSESHVSKDPTASLPNSSKLRYVSDDATGLTRKKRGRGFSYHDTKGGLIRSKARKRKLEALAIPPAWSDVWISPWPNGHILVTGRDQRGRKQYIYHPEWIEQRERAKFDRVLDFGRILPDVREAVERDMRRRTLSKPRVIATVVNLLETTLIRIGNPEYARANKSYGLTTLKNLHVDVEGRSCDSASKVKAARPSISTFGIGVLRIAYGKSRNCRDRRSFNIWTTMAHGRP